MSDDLDWLRMMLERLRQHAFSAGVFHSIGSPEEDGESAKAAEARKEILEEWENMRGRP
jgi:hypothetical protein